MGCMAIVNQVLDILKQLTHSRQNGEHHDEQNQSVDDAHAYGVIYPVTGRSL